MVFATNRRIERAPGATGADRSSQLSIIAAGTKLVGEVTVEGTVRVEGEIEGDVHVHGQLLLAPGGVITGDVDADDAILAGRLCGNARAGNRFELKRGGVVDGDVTSPRLLVEEGGRLNGQVTTSTVERLGRGVDQVEIPPFQQSDDRNDPPVFEMSA